MSVCMTAGAMLARDFVAGLRGLAINRTMVIIKVRFRGAWCGLADAGEAPETSVAGV